ncbi:DUF4190 domain-containing protein [Bifidobacterium avesanii]|uniref:DUF4190 domain-containing protein n=1 Tax=Bifidobacterium avesanii TaxID=1798157 RepID=A0A7K3TG01_9BIFI|nr:DUF4190 domain-containing protein [Bifidobacterium avesanii]KAB8294505.1 hypothetical protein DSM100685_0298 [Bifidobacterium avesanii]NEG78021.1 DUF4190 domain-containing protein [Bifidobacterium avesanii]
MSDSNFTPQYSQGPDDSGASSQSSSSSEPNSSAQSPYGQPQSAAQGGPAAVGGQSAFGQVPYGRPASGQASYGQAPQYGTHQGQPYGQPASGQPYGQPQYSPYSQYGQPAYGYQPYYPQSQQWNVLSIIGFALSFFIAPAGLIVSIIALAQINKSGEKSKGLAIAGIVVSAVLTLLAVIGIVAFASLFAEIMKHPEMYGDYYYGGGSDADDLYDMALRTANFATAFLIR